MLASFSDKMLADWSNGQWFKSTLSLDFTEGEESEQLSVIPGAGITRCSHIERKDLDTS